MTKPAFSARDLRDAFSTFATGVTIITAPDADGAPVGMTASSFNSVSVDPPLVLWSCAKAALSAPAFKAAQHFSVHVLGADQMGLSNIFAKSGTDKFAGVDFTTDHHGVPHIRDAITRFDCSTWNIYEGGDHWIIVGHVDHIQSGQGEGLVFSTGSYATAATIRPPQTGKDQASATEAPIENLLLYNLARAYNQMSGQFHDLVHQDGLSVPEWRVLASLQGQTTRSFPDLAARTFVDPKTLNDLVDQLERQGLCHVSQANGTVEVSGTDTGHARVSQLFKAGERHERDALKGEGDAGLRRLIELLQTVTQNTSP